MDRMYLNDLYDLYRNLLNEHETTIYELYHLEDLSLGEIADEAKVSRTAIHNVLKNAEEKLVMYEEKLELYKKRKTLEKVLELEDILEMKNAIDKLLYID